MSRGSGFDSRGIHPHLSKISRGWPNLIVGLEIDKSPAASFFKSQVDDPLEKPVTLTPNTRRLTSAPVHFCGFAGALENRMRQHSLYDFNSGFYFLLGSAERPSLKCCKTFDDID